MAGPQGTPVGAATADQLFSSGGGQSVPSAPMTSAAPLMASMMNQMESTKITDDDIKQALSPIQGGHSMQMPASLTRPINDPAPAQLDHRPVVGAGNARGQGIGNSVSSVVGAIATFKANHDRAKQTADATKVQQLIESQQAIDQAQQVLQQNPNDPAAKEALKHNTDVRNGLFSDPKFVKTVEKGFQISFTDPAANKTPEHGIVQKAIGMFKKEQAASPKSQASMGAQFEKKMPTQLAPNQMAQARLQIAQQQRKDVIEFTKSVMPAIVRAEGQQRTEMWKAQTELMKQQQAMTYRDMERVKTFNDRMALLGQQQKFAMQKLFAENHLILDREQKRLQMEGNDPNKLLHAADESDRTWTAAIANQQTQYDVASDAYNKLAATSKDPEVVTAARAELEARRTQLDSAKDQSSYYHKLYDARRAQMGLGSSDKDTSGGTNGKPAGNSTSGQSFNINSIDNWASPSPGETDSIGYSEGLNSQP